MKSVLNCLLFVAVFALSVSAHAQGWVTSTQVYGTTLTCISNSGAIVPLLLSEKAIELGGGGYARVDPVKGASIMISPSYLQKLPRIGAFFLFYHECAHVALPMGIGLGTEAQEGNADCYAVREMRKTGLITSWADFMEALTLIKNMPASSKGHLPGPDRVKAAAQCINIPIVRTTSSLCRSMDMVFAGGKAFLKKTPFENNNIFNGFYCEPNADGNSLDCSRNFEDENMSIAYQKNFRVDMKSCLPTDFKYSKVHVFETWSNDGTGQTINMKREFGDDKISFSITPEK